eukprot:CAMPEP_0178397348 /NCGR_PEP_ID=MMETSP0689_2-20121128/14198_1 /TAXON_ID=160604 /ORGANISM="Amphidinium massartii, Strain CS-259" /LENGTH=816 /DNA_ID=CAMNT_0020018051 /DNA_START=137 /DNA_END=2583 /DNA_ORIENTATION=+
MADFYVAIEQAVEAYGNLERENAALRGESTHKKEMQGHVPSDKHHGNRGPNRDRSGPLCLTPVSNISQSWTVYLQNPPALIANGSSMQKAVADAGSGSPADFEGVIIDPDTPLDHEETGGDVLPRVSSLSSIQAAERTDIDQEQSVTRRKSVNGTRPMGLLRDSQSQNSLTSQVGQPKALDCWGWWNEQLYDDENFSMEGSREGSWRIQFAKAHTAKVSRKIRVGQSSVQAGRFQWLVLRPSSTKRTTWDLLSTVMLLYDIFFIPLEVFELPESQSRMILDWTTSIFWIVDMFVSALTGYYANEVVELRIKKTVPTYLRSWFPLDICTVITDLLLLTLGSGVSEAVGAFRVNKTVRLVRVLRFLRLLRLRKVRKALNDLHDTLQSEYTRIWLNIFVLLLFIIILNHYIACGWYGIGRANFGDYNLTWLKSHSNPDGSEDDRGRVYWYSTSLQWSLTQFTPAGMEVHAVNTIERFFSVGVLLFALVTFSSFLSSITASMTSLRQLQKEAYQMESSLRKYFRMNDISAELGVCILKHCKKARKGRKRRYLEWEVPVLMSLPEHLQVRVHEEVYLGSLLHMPFFEYYAAICQSGAREICHRAVSMKHLRSGETSFFEGEQAIKAVIVAGGTMEYKMGLGLEEDCGEFCHINDCVGQNALWLEWRYVGRLLGGEHSEVLELDGDAFRKVVLSDYHMLSREIVIVHARMYTEWVLQLDPSSYTDLPTRREGKILLRARTIVRGYESEEGDLAKSEGSMAKSYRSEGIQSKIPGVAFMSRKLTGAIKEKQLSPRTLNHRESRDASLARQISPQSVIGSSRPT